MHFYDFNIGDYAKKTQHLTNEEDLAYRRLLDMYYDTENPMLTTGLATLSRRLRVDEKSLKNVLDEFFPNGRNKHADEVIAEYHAFCERQKVNGSKGGRPKHKPSANPVLTQNNPVPSQPLPTKPLPTKQIESNTLAQAEKNHSAIAFDFTNGEFSNINGQLVIWGKAYPAINLTTEINKAAAWLIANPKNRKSNYAKFLTGWFSRCQDKAPAKGGGKIQEEFSMEEFMRSKL